MLSAPTPQIAVVNESSHVDDHWTWNAAWVLAYQLRWQVGPLLKLGAPEVSAIPKGGTPPPGAWILHLIDKITDVPGALGYHDEDGNEIPYGHIGIETALENNQQPMEVLSHEGIEMLLDPHVNLTSFSPADGRLYPVEACDPVQGFSYDLGAPYRKTVGWIVSDFILDGWFDPNHPATSISDYRGGIKGPFALGTQGYVSYATQLPPEWQEEMGEHANPAIRYADDRVQRRLARSATA